MLTRFIAAALLALPAFAMAAQAATAFRDIPEGNWAQQPAMVLAEANIMPGRTPIDFAGSAPISRYELAHILSELYNVSGPPSTFVVLQDMPPGHFATPEVQRVIGFGLMTTRKPGRFEGNENATRLEVIRALDELFMKNGVTPPGRRPKIAIFSDVPPNSELGARLERIVNRFGLFEARSERPFYPYGVFTRYEVLGMLVRAIPYLNPQLATRLQAPAPTPAPTASGASPRPSLAPASPGPSGAPASPGPSSAPATSAPSTTEAGFPEEPILRSWGYGGAEVLLSYAEALPTEPGSVASGEQKEFSGNFLGGAAVGGDLWFDRLGLNGRLATFYVPVDVTVGGKLQPNDVLDTIVQVGGGYKLLGGPDWEAALGAGGLFRYTRNLSVEGNTYLTADKLYVGAGPLAAYGYRASEAFTFTTGLGIYPVLMQNYTLPAGAVRLGRWAVDGHLRGEYWFTKNVFASGGGHLLMLAGAGGRQTLLGVTLGAGVTF